MASTDISTAFLQGVSYAELAAETGEAERDVNFDVCIRALPIVQQLPGYADFNPTTEVLHCDKPGTGCRDAPKAFSQKLRNTTRAFGLRSALIDTELEGFWQGTELKMLVLKHVDDIKMCGPKELITALVTHLSNTFGKLEIAWHDFTFCGIHHVQDPITKEVTMDQTKFIAAIKPMQQPEVITSPGDQVMPEPLHKHFLSLLMTLAYAVQSRPDISVYIAALQKESEQATYEAARRLNKVLAWAQKHLHKIHYGKLRNGSNDIVLVSDSAFKAKEDTGLSMRGLAVLRMDIRDFSTTGQVRCHLLHTVSKTQRHVTRSTFASELFAANDALDFGLIQWISFHEFLHGPTTWSEVRTMQESFTTDKTVKVALVLDARSVTAAATAPVLKAPAENSALVAVAWLREKLKRRELDELYWADTRVMLADGLTKGSIDRSNLQAAMKGIWTISVKLVPQLLK